MLVKVKITFSNFYTTSDQIFRLFLWSLVLSTKLLQKEEISFISIICYVSATKKKSCCCEKQSSHECQNKEFAKRQDQRAMSMQLPTASRKIALLAQNKKKYCILSRITQVVYCIIPKDRLKHWKISCLETKRFLCHDSKHAKAETITDLNGEELLRSAPIPLGSGKF